VILSNPVPDGVTNDGGNGNADTENHHVDMVLARRNATEKYGSLSGQHEADKECRFAKGETKDDHVDAVGRDGL
jgi:hypothetical protein